MSDFPTGPARVDSLADETRKLIAEAAQAAAAKGGDLTDFARRILTSRGNDNRPLHTMLFTNPAWDILLNLYIAETEGRGMTVLDCCLASVVRQSVALRWLTYLKQEGMVLEVTDITQPRQTQIQLSESTKSAIASYLGSLINLDSPPEGKEPPPASE